MVIFSLLYGLLLCLVVSYLFALQLIIKIALFLRLLLKLKRRFVFAVTRLLWLRVVLILVLFLLRLVLRRLLRGTNVALRLLLFRRMVNMVNTMRPLVLLSNRGLTALMRLLNLTRVRMIGLNRITLLNLRAIIVRGRRDL